ncbi:Vms1/Ankzf1 family peptidyl-tRNA hydrolase [Halocalculus aciditolerans]|uniref:Peptide chain release factor 1 n=1 Tax=Halocalculus aciditolerans TaxID=1383812 RepID=A0A830FGC2_9EURY|nr:Vms1/Ankzf1 family peptidyl-tRNA hydrolase [Halocalculus aciditolerans]GGL52520.1 peptide chain release factor 1 [Halocalculus aciditolerans]
MASFADRLAAVRSVDADENRLVSLTLPPDGDLNAALADVEEDHAAAEYLDESASEPVVEALGAVRHRLHEYTEIPDGGLAVYAGVVDGSLTEFVFDDLDRPVSERVYAVENAFVTEPLDAAERGGGRYGLLVVERGGAALGVYEDGGVTPVERVDSDVMGKHSKGGQSAARFARRREAQKRAFFAEVGAAAADAFTDPLVDGLALGGTEITVEEFRDADVLDYRLADRLLDTYPVDHASETGLRELAERARDDFDADGEVRETLDAFFDGVGDETVAYGVDAVDDALTYGAVDTLLVAASLDAERRQHLRERAEDEGGDCVVVSADSDRGARFVRGFDGVGALLRFPIE